MAESRYNFLRRGELKERWAKLGANNHFSIAETGFGTGLNFLACWQMWQQCQPQGTLEFISFEKYPLTPNELAPALGHWPELEDLSSELLDQYPKILAPGWHRLNFAQNKVCLSLFIGDAQEGLQQLKHSQHPLFAKHNRQIDAWFLDGFSPAKNPDMWQPAIFDAMAELSRSQASYATFTTAGPVRRALLEVGFSAEKDSGFGLKREMLYGQLLRHPSPKQAPEGKGDWSQHSAYNSPYTAPWHISDNLDAPETQSALIIGGGIAGCTSARSLADAGVRVTVLEQHSALAQEGSGNPQGVLYAKLSHRPETLSQFNLFSLLYAQRFYREFLADQNTRGQACGVAQLAINDKTFAAQKKTLALLKQYGNTHSNWCQQLNAKELSETAGVELGSGGLVFKDSGWLDPSNACRELLNHKNISVQFNQKIVKLERVHEQWQAFNQQGDMVASADVAVIANANAAKELAQTQELPVKAVRGQVSYANANAQSNRLKTVLCGRGYIAPASEGQHCLGASFNLHETGLELSAQEQVQNYQHLCDDMPTLHTALAPEAEVLRGRAALRCTSPDYLPLAGPVPQRNAMQERFALLSKNARASIPEAGSYYPGLFVNIAHGSRGICYAPITAAILSSWILKRPAPLGQNINLALHPARFMMRELVRKKA